MTSKVKDKRNKRKIKNYCVSNSVFLSFSLQIYILALTASGRLRTLFELCDFVSSLQDVFEERYNDWWVAVTCL